jgi:hypothetical protein
MRTLLGFLCLVTTAVAVPAFKVAGQTVRSPPFKSGDTYGCSLTFIMTTFSKGTGTKREIKGLFRTSIRITDSTLEATSVGAQSDATVTSHPISTRDGDSLLSMDTNGQGVRETLAFHKVGEGVAVYARATDSYRNASGGITMITENGTCRKSR